MEIWKKMAAFVLLALALVAIVNGIGYTAYYGQYFTSVCTLVLALMAWPTLRRLIDVLRN